QRRLAVVALLVARPEPVPAARVVRGAGLRRVSHEELELVGELIHARADGEVIRGLPAAVQHHNERQRLPAEARRKIHFVGARAGRVGVRALDEPPWRVVSAPDAPGARQSRADLLDHVFLDSLIRYPTGFDAAQQCIFYRNRWHSEERFAPAPRRAPPTRRRFVVPARGRRSRTQDGGAT